MKDLLLSTTSTAVVLLLWGLIKAQTQRHDLLNHRVVGPCVGREFKVAGVIVGTQHHSEQKCEQTSKDRQANRKIGRLKWSAFAFATARTPSSTQKVSDTQKMKSTSVML